ncbi:MAG: head GIN domain-containing protein [Pseudomonadota bacterium]
MRTFVILAAAFPLIACNVMADNDRPGVAGTGSGTTRTYAVADFTKVALRGSDDIDVRVGTAFSVRAEGDAEVLDYLKIEKDGDTLKVGRRNRDGFNWGGKSAKIYVTMPRIAAGSVAGSGDLAIDRAEGAGFEASTAGSGNIAVATLAVDSADFSIAGSGSIAAGGTAKAVNASIAGSGDIDAKRLKASGAEVSIAGSGSVAIDVTGNAKVSIVGSGDADLGKGAKCSTSKMGSGTVTCG